MKCEAGKYYRTRGGHKAIVSAIVPPSPDGKTTHGLAVLGYVLDDGEWVERYWAQEGLFFLDGQEHDHDLVAPWIDPPEVKIELAERATTGAPRVLLVIGNGPTRAFGYDGVYLGEALAREHYTNIRPYEPAKSDA